MNEHDERESNRSVTEFEKLRFYRHTKGASFGILRNNINTCQYLLTKAWSGLYRDSP